MTGPTQEETLVNLLERLSGSEILDDLEEELGELTESERALLEDLRREPTPEEVEEMRREMGPEFFENLKQKILAAIRAEEGSRPR